MWPVGGRDSRRTDLLDSVDVGVLREQPVVQALFQRRPLGGAVLLQKAPNRQAKLTERRRRNRSGGCASGRCGYRGGAGVLVAVVLPPQPQHVLRTVEELGEAVELAVAEVDGSLDRHGGHLVTPASARAALGSL